MKKMILTLFARTPVHVGAGNSVGAVDSPVQRERHTKIPIIPGSSLKGVLADLWNDENYKRTSEGKALFGEDDNNADAKAGALMIGEARVLAFPVRSAKGMFAWITCPLALRRFARDSEKEMPEIQELDAQSCLASDELLLNDFIVLEEYRIKRIGDCAPVISLLENLATDAVWQEYPKHLVVLSDEMFSYFCEQACEVITRIRIDDETGTVAKGALFNQEQVPSETLFYTLCYANEARTSGVKEMLQEKLKDGVLQVGGDASTGLGYCSVEVL